MTRASGAVVDDLYDLRAGLSRSKHLSLRERLKYTTWAYFLLNMATSGLANIFHAAPYSARWVEVIGLMFFVLNLGLFVIVCGMMLTRFMCYPSTFWASFTHPTESLFVPAFAVAFGSILINIVEFGAQHTGQWLTRTVLVLFWFDIGVALTLSVAIYMILWSKLTFTLERMTPIWIFPAYPMLLIGPHAADLSAKLTDTHLALQVVVGGFTVQGIGLLVSLTIYSAFVYRLMTQKLPQESLRPGMFVSVGPAAFTCSGTIGMALNLPRIFAHEANDTYMGVPSTLAAQILMLVANWACLWLWGLAIWFFFVSAVSNIAPFFARKNHKVSFAMTWFSYIFPQTALTTATLRVADAFSIPALRIIGSVMIGILVLVWILVVSAMIKAIYTKHLLWPELEDEAEIPRTRID